MVNIDHGDKDDNDDCDHLTLLSGLRNPLDQCAALVIAPRVP